MGEKASGIGQVPALMADHAVGETNVCGLNASLETSCVGNFIQNSYLLAFEDTSSEGYQG